MNEQPRTVVCSSCSAKFHVPDELIRGKLVKFRCRKCGEAIDVDGRRSAQAAVATAPATVEMTPVDTPATFSQRTLPPTRPPTTLSSSSPGLHPWPEPPRTRSTAPTAHSPSAAPPPEESSTGFETIRDPSNRGPKIAAVVALLVAAGLSGVGLAMRSTPGTSAGILVHNMALVAPPSDPPDPVSVVPARAAGAAQESDPSQSSRTPTRVTDLPIAVDGVDPAATSTAPAAPKPSESLLEKLEKKAPQAAHEEPPAGPMGGAANNEAPAVVAPPAPAQPAAVAHPAVPDELPAEPPPSPPAVAPAAVVNAPRANAPNAPAAVANAPAPNPPAAQPANPAPAGPPAAARAANKGDFNTQAAREALEDAADRAAKCKTIDSPSGTARIAVTFAPSGQATNAVIESGPFVGTAAGTCVASKFRTVRVPAFSGEPVQVHKSIPF
jgi:predicted Zn finger-like uncharacterized protein